MARAKEDVRQALIDGARNSGSEYVSVRREDLLIALGAEPSNEEPKGNQKDQRRTEKS